MTPATPLARWARRGALGAALVLAAAVAPVTAGAAGADPTPQPHATSTAAPTAGAIVYASPPAQPNGDGTLWLLPKGGTPSRIAAGERPVLSPDGTQLAFVRGATDRDHGDLWVRSLATGQETQVAAGDTTHSGFTWSDSGTLLYDSGCSFFTATVGSGETVSTAPLTGPGGTCPDADPVKNPADGSIWWSNLASGLDSWTAATGRDQIAGTQPGAVLPRFGAGHVVWLQLADPAGSDLLGNLETRDSGTVRAVTDLDTTTGDGVRGPGVLSTDGAAVLAPATVQGVSGLWQFPFAGGRPQLLATPAAGSGGSDPAGDPASAAVLAGVAGGYAETPLPQDDTASVPAGRSVTIDVLANDLGPVDATTLSASASGVTVSSGKLTYTAPASGTTSATFTYTVCATGRTACATATVRVAVGDTVDDHAHPVITTGTLPTLTPGVQATFPVHVSNPGNAAFAVDVSGQSDRPGGSFSLTSSSSFWSCSSLTGASHCSATQNVPKGALPDLTATVTDPTGPNATCTADATRPCLPLALWVGQPTSSDRAASQPPAVAVQVPVNGPLLKATVAADAPFVAGSDGTWSVTVTNAGPAAAPAASSTVTLAVDAPLTAVTATGPDGWTCTANGPGAAQCQATAGLAAGASVVLKATVHPAAEGTAGLAVGWGSDSTTAIALAHFTTPVAAAPRVVDAAVALSHAPVGTTGTDLVDGGTGTYSVAVTNAGTTVLPTSLSAVLTTPTGVNPDSATGKGWTCSYSSSTATCSWSGAGVAAGGKLPVLAVHVTVLPTSTGGQASVTVTTAGDHNAADDTATDPTRVNPTGGPAGITVSVSGPPSVEAGTTATEAFTVTESAAPAAGDQTLQLLAYVPRAPFTPPTATGTGWTCRTMPVGSGAIFLVSCSHAVQPAAGPLPAVSIPFAASPIGAGGSPQVPYEVIRVGTGGSQAPGVIPNLVLPITPVLRAAIDVGVSGPPRLSGLPQTYVVNLTDVGTGATTAATAVVTAPDGARMLAATSPGWFCTAGTTPGGDDQQTCTPTNPAVPASQSFPALSFGVFGTPGIASSAYSISVAVTAADAHGPLSATGSRTVLPPYPGTPVLAVTRSYPTGKAELVNGTYTETLVVSNTGTGQTDGRLTLAEQLPVGFTATATGQGWTCAQAARALTCTRPTPVDTGHLRPGSSAPAVTVVATPTLSGLHGLSTFSASATTAGAQIGGLSIPAATTPVAAVGTLTLTLADIERQIQAHQKTALTFDQQPFDRGAAETVHLQVSGDQLPDQTLAGGLLLPTGLTVVSVPQTVPVTITYARADGQAATAAGAAMRCQASPTLAGVACAVPAQTLPAGATGASYAADVLVHLQVAPNPGTSLTLQDGFAVPSTESATVRPPVAVVVTALANALDTRGANALGRPGAATVAVTGFVADAGAPQRLVDATPDASGNPTPTRVQLTSRSTNDPGRPLAYGWTQTAGPAVSWEAASTSAAAAGGPAFPGGATFAAYGTQVAFHAPTVPEQTDLTFQVTVTDGDTTSVATTTVTLTPFGDRPPVVTGITVESIKGLQSRYTALPAGTTPPAGAHVRLTAAGTDPDGDPLTWSFTVLRPTDHTVAFASTGGDGHVVTFLWPSDTPVAEVEATASDGHVKSVFDLLPGALTGHAKPRLSLPPGTVTATGPIGQGPGAVVNAASTVLTPQPVTASTSVVIGLAPAPLQPAVTGPGGGAVPGSLTQGQTTVLSETPPAGSTVSWTQTAGPAGAIPAGATGPTVTVTAPAPAKPGDSITIRATTTSGTGAQQQVSTRDVTIALAALQAPTVSVVTSDGSAPSFSPGGSLTLSAAVTGGQAPFTYAWAVGAPATGASTSSSVTVSDASTPGTATVSVTVTDALHATATASVPVLIGPSVSVPAGPTATPTATPTGGATGTPSSGPTGTSGPSGGPTGTAGPTATPTGGATATPSGGTTATATPSGGGTATPTGGPTDTASPTPTDGGGGGVTPPSPCDVGQAFRTIYDAVHGGGNPTLHLGPIALAVGQPTGAEGPLCGASVTITLTNASVNLGPVQITGVNGTITKDGLTLNSGSVKVPSSWGLASGTITAPVKLVYSTPSQVSGAVKWNGLAFLKAPSTIANASTTLTFGSGQLVLASSADVLHGTATLAATISYATPGNFTVTLTGTGLKAFGNSFNAGGTLTSSNGTVTSNAHLDLAAPADLPGGVHLATASLAWTGSALTATGAGTFGKSAADGGSGKLDLTLSGRFDDADDWSLTGGAVPEDAVWKPLPGLSLNKASTSLQGSVTSVHGAITYTLTASLGGSWVIGPVTVSSLSATVANTAPPAECASTVVADGSGKYPVWLDLSGAGTIALPKSGASASLAVHACLDPSHQAWSFTSTADLASYQPFSSIPLTLDSVSLSGSGDATPADFRFSLAGQAHVRGASIGGSLTVVGSDVVVDANGDLSSLGTALPRGHIDYATSALSVDLRDPTLPAGNTAVPQGLSAVGAFQLPTSFSGFLQSKLSFSSPPVLTVQAALGDGTPTLTATLTLPNGGLTLFGNPSDQTQTSLTVTGVFLQLSASGSFGLGASGALNLPPPDPTGAAGGGASSQRSVLNVTVEVTVDVTGPSITLALFYTGDWNNAAGITGLTISDLAIQGGIDFTSAPPTPSIGFGATVKHLPDALAAKLGIVQPANGAYSEGITFVVNISTTHPVFALTLGKADGQTFLKPLTFVGGSATNALQVDDASFVFAPNGGQVGPYTFGRGVHLAFDATILNDKVSVAADLSLDPTSPSLTADLSLGPVTVAGISLKQTTAHLSATPTGGLNFAATGGISIGSASLQATATVTAGLTSGLHLALQTTASAVPLGFATLNNFSLSGSADFGPAPASTTGAPGAPGTTAGQPSVNYVPTVTLSAAASLTVLGATAQLAGTVTFSPLGLTGASLSAGLNALHVGPLTVGSPAPGTACGTLQNVTGPCVTVGVNLLSSVPLTVKLAGSVTVGGFGLSFSGGLDGTGVSVDNASINLGPVGNVAVNGHLYLGTQLSGVTATDYQGVSHPVQQGDFVVNGALNAGFAGFTVNGGIKVGHLGGTDYVDAYGSASVFSSSLMVNALLGFSNGSISYDLSGATTVVVDGYRIVSATVHLTPSGGSLNGSLTIGPVASASFGGSFTSSNGNTFWNFSGGVTVNVADFHLTGSVTFTHDGSGTAFTVHSQVSLASFTTIVINAAVDSAGNFCASGTVAFLKVAPFPNGWVTGTGNYCDYSGFSFTLTVAGYTVWPVNVPSQNPSDLLIDYEPSFNLGPYGADGFTVGASGHVVLKIYDDAFPTLTLSASAYAQGCIDVSFFGIGPGEECANVDGSITADLFAIPPSFTISADILGAKPSITI